MGRLGAFIEGRVDLQVHGNQIEGFINRAHRSGIPLYSPRRTGDGLFFCTVPARSFKKLRSPAFKSGVRIKILKKRGLFIAARPFRRRWGLVIGLLIFMGLTIYCSGFVWQIEVRGCEETSYTQILADLEALGLKIGCRNTIDVGAIENQYLIGNDKLSWMSVNIRGTTAYVEVKEQGAPPKKLDAFVPTNIYAARDGVIVSINDYQGSRCVQPGEAVSAGDLLVTGDWTDQYGVRRLNHCIATIRAETRRETEVVVPLKEPLRQKTGRRTKKFAISLGNWKIPLYFNKKIGYNEYDIMEKVCPLQIGSFAFPVCLYVSVAEEVQSITLERSTEQARALAADRLGFYEIDHLADAVIYKREIEERQTDQALTLRATFYCEEEIGIEMPIEY